MPNTSVADMVFIRNKFDNYC